MIYDDALLAMSSSTSATIDDSYASPRTIDELPAARLATTGFTTRPGLTEVD